MLAHSDYYAPVLEQDEDYAADKKGGQVGEALQDVENAQDKVRPLSQLKADRFIVRSREPGTTKEAHG